MLLWIWYDIFICYINTQNLNIMKRLLSIAFLALFSLNALAQQVDLRKKITVSGAAEMEVTPDII